MAEDLVGMSFLRLEDDGACKGAVLARVGAEHYLKELCSCENEHEQKPAPGSQLQ